MVSSTAFRACAGSEVSRLADRSQSKLPPWSAYGWSHPAARLERD